MALDRKISSPSTGVAANAITQDEAADEIQEELAGLWARSTCALTLTGGTANALEFTCDPTLEVFAAGMEFLFVVTDENTASVTAEVDSEPAVDLVDEDGEPLVGGELQPGRLNRAIYFAGELRLIQGGGAGAGGSAAPVLMLEDQKTSGTDGGTATSGADQTRTLNQEVRNVLPGASLAANQFTLPAGKHFIAWGAPGRGTGAHQSMLYNVTAGAVAKRGASMNVGASDNEVTVSLGFHYIELVTSAVFEIRHRVGSTQATTGYGIAGGFGTEHYTWVNVYDAGDNEVSSLGQPGGAVTIPYVFSTTTADADPGNGKLRLDNATQNTATTIRADLLDEALVTVTAVLDSLDDSTNPVKGYIRLVKATDRSKWLLFRLLSIASPAGYRNLTVTIVASSAASPFADADPLLFEFTPSGDRGLPGLQFGFDSSTVMADPGTGEFRLNNATIASVTAIAISGLSGDTGNPDVSDFIATWGDSTNAIRGHIVIQDASAPAEYAIYAINGAVTDNGAWLQIPVSFVSQGTAPTFETDAVFTFYRAGDKGDVPAALSWNFSTTTADADPGSGIFRANNATFASVTLLYVDNNERGGNSVTAFLDAMDDAGVIDYRGFLTLVQISDATKFATFKVTGSVVDGTGYRKLTVVPVAGANFPFTNGSGVSFLWSPAATSSPGLEWAFSTTTSDADPGAGTFRANNATFGSVTQLFMDNADRSGAAVTTHLDAMDDSGNSTLRGWLHLQCLTNPALFATFKVTGSVVDGTGYRKLTVTPMVHNGFPWTAGLGFAVIFSPAGPAPVEAFVIAVSDETTALTTGTAKITFRMPYAFTVTAVRGSLSTAQASGSIFTVDINEGGTTILSTKLTIDNTEKTSTTAATPPVVSDASLADDAEMTIDIDQIGDGTAKGLKIYIIGTRT